MSLRVAVWLAVLGLALTVRAAPPADDLAPLRACLGGWQAAWGDDREAGAPRARVRLKDGRELDVLVAAAGDLRLRSLLGELTVPLHLVAGLHWRGFGAADKLRLTNGDCWRGEIDASALVLATANGQPLPPDQVDALTFSHLVFVNPAAKGTNTGHSWADARTDLGEALRHCPPGTEVWLAAGVYTPWSADEPRAATFRLPAGVALFGGFRGNEQRRSERDPLAQRTILSGEIGRPQRDDNVYTVVYLEDGALLDGVTVTGAGGDRRQRTPGGGILMRGGQALIRHTIIVDNQAGGDGGGGAFLDGARPLFVNCVIADNRSFGDGGAVAVEAAGPVPAGIVVAFVNCAVADNWGSACSGLRIDAQATPIFLLHCTLTGQRGHAGVAASLNGQVTMANCLLWGNLVDSRFGPGGYILLRGGSLRLDHCLLDTAITDIVRLNGAAVTAEATRALIPGLVARSNAVGADGIFLTDDDGLCLQPDSVAIGAGRRLDLVPADLRGAERRGEGVDIGAYAAPY